MIGKKLLKTLKTVSKIKLFDSEANRRRLTKTEDLQEAEKNNPTAEGGSTAEALEDFTGGLIEHYDLGECPKDALLALMIRAFQMGSMFGCSIDVSRYCYL
uniref:Calpain catalytic domain-containing protein n=1 Tax=Parascaris equorum TaxID=6256 RepID=A0A914S6A4_PAREQ